MKNKLIFSKILIFRFFFRFSKNKMCQKRLEKFKNILDFYPQVNESKPKMNNDFHFQIKCILSPFELGCQISNPPKPKSKKGFLLE